MSEKQFVQHLIRKNSQIDIIEIFYGYLDTYLSKGLRVLTICNDGTGRSATVAESLNAAGIPSVRLNHGLRQFIENAELDQSASFAYSTINRCPNVAVILTSDEVNLYRGIILNLRCSKYPDSNSAIKSIKIMEL